MTTENAAAVQLVFRGEVLPGFRVADVERALGARLRIDAAGLARLFTTPRTVLKKSVAPAEAARYIATFARLGAILHAEATGAAAATTRATTEPAEPPMPAPTFAAFSAAMGDAALPAAAAPAPEPARAAMPPPSPTLASVPAAGAATSRTLMPVASDGALSPVAEPARAAPALAVAFPTLPDLDLPEPAPPVAAVPSPPPSPSPVAAPPPPWTSLAKAPSATAPPTMAPPPPAPIAALALAADPVPPDTAADEVVCPACETRQPRRVLCRSCATDIPMALAAREEARQAERAARLERRRAELGLESEAAATDAPTLWGLGFHGRLGRLPYWTGGIVGGTVMYLLLVFVLQRPDGGRWTLLGLFGIAYAFYCVRWTALRLHDLNLTAWWSVVLFVPYVGAACSLALSFVPGASKDNDHGEPPRPGRWRHILIALGVLVLVFAVTFNTLLRGVARMASESEEDDLVPFDGPVATAPVFTPAGAPAAAPGGLAEDPTPAILGRDARVDFLGAYATAQPFKAFAASPSGPHGWHGGAASLSRAAAEAMQQCDARRRTDQLPCEIVDAAAR